MDPRGTKFFDVARPNQVGANATSRPIIVGHRPMMMDPMMRAEQSRGLTTTTPEIRTHKAKIIQVSDEIKNEIATAPTVTTEPPVTEAAAAPAVEQPLPPADSTGIGEVPAEKLPLTASETTATDAAPGTPAPPAAAADDPQKPPQPAAETLVPTPDLSHIPHVPVSHNQPSSTGKIKHLALWAAVIIILLGFGTYLAIDAGLVASSVHLPLHIFNRQA